MRDAFFQPPVERDALAVAKARGMDAAEAMAMLGRQREAHLRLMADDPFRNGYEPEIWLVAKALLRNTKPLPRESAAVKRVMGMGWDEWAARTREALGFAHPVGELLIMGANRSGKTDFAARLAMSEAMLGGRSINIGFQSLPTGKQVQEPRVWHYLPKELKKTVKTADEYIAYTKQNGFSGSKMTFANGSSVRFITYEMRVEAAMEGSALNFCWLDEEFPKSFLEAARFRCSSVAGNLVMTFTPISGMTPVVSEILEGMKVTKWHTAYMLPSDGRECWPWAELGLGEEEWNALSVWRNTDRAVDPCIPESRPERCLKWALGVTDDIPPAERSFGRVPRVAVCRGGEVAAVWFYGGDNPYGTPGEVIQQALKNRNATAMIKKRVYGVATRIKGRMFPEFSREKHVVAPERIPSRLVRCMVVDPAPERNWTCGWYGYEPVSDVLYKYRDWPGAYEIPGVGIPGPWAVPSDRKGGVNDGDRGDAQEPFGFGYSAYKFEWARLEGWRNYTEWAGTASGASPRPDDGVVEEWSEVDGVAERMAFRIIDSRAASQSKIHQGETRSLFEDVSALAEGFTPASGQSIEVGVNMIRDRLNTGRYLISAECVNTIFAYETYTGADGQKGACKDFIDCDRYVTLSDLTGFGADDATAVGESAGFEDARRARASRARRRRPWI